MIGRSGGFGGPIKGPNDGGGGGVSPQGRFPWRKRCKRRLIRDPNVKKERVRGGKGDLITLMSQGTVYLHEQTGLTAGTIANDNELASDLSHLERMKVS